MKKNKVFLLSALLALLVSCGGNSSSSATTKNEITNPWWTTTGELEFDSDGKIVYDEVSLRLASVVAGDDSVALDSIISKFNTLYRGKINVIVENIGQEIFEKTVADRVTQKSNAPDLIMSHLKGHKTFAHNKIVQPLNEALEVSRIDYKPTDIVSNLSTYSDLGHPGYVFNVPVDAQSMVVFYNKKLLAKYNDGVPPEGKDELFAVAKRAKQGEGSGFKPVVVPKDSLFFSWYFGRTALVQNGFEFFDKETHLVKWGEEKNLTAMKKALTSINEIFYGANAISDYNISEASAVNDFTKGRALFLIYLPWQASSLFSKFSSDNGGISIAEVKENWVGATSIAGMFQENMADRDAYKIYGDSHAFALTNSVTDITTKVAAAEFINFFAKDVDTAVEWAHAGHISAAHEVRNNAVYNEDDYVNNYIEQFYTDLNEFVSAGNTPFYSATFDELDRIVAQNIKNDFNPDDLDNILKESADNVNLLIEWGI